MCSVHLLYLIEFIREFSSVESRKMSLALSQCACSSIQSRQGCGTVEDLLALLCTDKWLSSVVGLEHQNHTEMSKDCHFQSTQL